MYPNLCFKGMNDIWKQVDFYAMVYNVGFWINKKEILWKTFDY
jgi:hypothetical protein